MPKRSGLAVAAEQRAEAGPKNVRLTVALADLETVAATTKADVKTVVDRLQAHLPVALAAVEKALKEERLERLRSEIAEMEQEAPGRD